MFNLITDLLDIDKVYPIVLLLFKKNLQIQGNVLLDLDLDNV